MNFGNLRHFQSKLFSAFLASLKRSQNRALRKVEDGLPCALSLQKSPGQAQGAAPGGINNLFSTGRIFLQKVENKTWQRLKRYVEYRLDLRHPTFERSTSDRYLHSYSHPILPVPGTATIQLSAAQVLAHEFDLLGTPIQASPPECPGYNATNQSNQKESRRISSLIDTANYHPIDWHLDFKSGYRWPVEKWYFDIPLNPEKGTDVKVPWELGRMQHLVPLMLGYSLSKSGAQGFLPPEIYADEFRNQVLDFISANPPRFGVQWRCTMDAAIRVANWLLCYDAFKTLGVVFDADFERVFTRSIYEHGRHIIKNLEIYPEFRNNHYLSDLVGLVFAGSYLSDIPDAGRWKAFAIGELKKEMETQVYPDGTNFEASTCYHRLAVELFFHATYLAVVAHSTFDGKNHREVTERLFGRSYVDRLYKVFDAVYSLIKPDGTMPQIGDNDSGQLFKLYPRSGRDVRYLLSFGAIFFKECRWKIREFFTAPDDLAEAEIVFGSAGREIWEGLSWSSISAIESHAFPDSGWYVMRGGSHYCLVSNGAIGLNGIGGHAHNDKLSFELVLHGREIIVDPGTYVYGVSSEWRNRFRSIQSHNTVIVNGLEQDEFDPRTIFRLRQCCNVKSLEFTVGKEQDVFVGLLSHPQYTLQRRIELDKLCGKLIIRDELRAGSLPYYANLVLSPGVRAEEFSLSTDGTMTPCEGWFSPEYGQKVPTQVLQIRDHRYLEISS